MDYLLKVKNLQIQSQHNNTSIPKTAAAESTQFSLLKIYQEIMALWKNTLKVGKVDFPNSWIKKQFTCRKIPVLIKQKSRRSRLDQRDKTLCVLQSSLYALSLMHTHVVQSFGPFWNTYNDREITISMWLGRFNNYLYMHLCKHLLKGCFLTDIGLDREYMDNIQRAHIIAGDATKPSMTTVHSSLSRTELFA